MKDLNSYMRYILILSFIMLGLGVQAQGYNIGIRAGLGQNKFSGPLETGESYGLTGGFHFGIAFQWNFSDLVGVRSEILYNQMGSAYNLDTDQGYYIFEPEDGLGNILIRDESSIVLDHSNAYLQLPQTVHIRLGEKFELFGGGYISFLISPVATGNILFGGQEAEKEHSFRQGLNFEYFNDDGEQQFSFFNTTGNPILIRANGRDVTLRGIENSFDYNSFDIEPSKFLSIDYGLIIGGAYYLNRGLYLMGRAEWGMRDITRNTADYSFSEVNDNRTPVFKNDVDKNFGVYLSIGFKF